METRQLIICGLLSGLTPLMVLLNTFSTPPSPAQTNPKLIKTAIALPALRWLKNDVPWSDTAIFPEIPMGMARIIQTNGQYFLEFHNSFTRLEQTLDLQLMLSDAAVPSHVIGQEGTLKLGPLQWSAGPHRYALPAIALEQYQSVVIWCEDLNVVVGYTPL